MRFSLSLGAWIFAVTGLLVLLVAGGALALHALAERAHVERALSEELDAGLAVQSLLQQQRFQRLELIATVFRTDQTLAAYVAGASEDPRAILDVVEEYQNRLRFDLAIVLDRDGRVLARTDRPDEPGEDLSQDPLVVAATADKQALAVWPVAEKLYHAGALTLVEDFDLVGTLIVGFAVDDALALRIQRLSGAQTVFLTSSPAGFSAAASTLSPAESAELVAALRVQGEVLGRVAERGEMVEGVALELAGVPWRVSLAPLRDAAETPVGTALAASPAGGRSVGGPSLPLLLLGLAAAALAAAFLLSRLLARRFDRPLGLLAAATERAGRGEDPGEVPAGGPGNVGVLARSLRALLTDLRERRALEHLVAHVQRFVPEPAKGLSLDRPQAREAVLVGVDMRRFANPKLAYDPDEAVERMTRDLRRISTAAQPRKGRIESLLGHRALVVFEGNGAAGRAVAAATEILQVLSERESVFDEPEPPVVVVASGSVVTGSVAWGDRPAAVTAGLPIQQLESLMREAAPGEITLSQTIRDALAEPLERAGLEPSSQRGLLSPQPLYVLSAEIAAQLTGVAAPAPAATSGTGFPGERRSLAEVTPGTVLGNRFEILAELGAGPMGTSLKARDRELGDLVTLKLLKPEVLADAPWFERIRGAVGVLRGIRHPNLLGVFDFAEIDGVAYVSMEFVRGLSLRYLLDQTRRLDWVSALRLMRLCARGLAAAHQHGLAHRGLKPENVLVEPRGNVRLMDLGLSATAGEMPHGAEYLAPEQLGGDLGGPASDLYALGAVVYETLTGRVPFTGASAAQLRQIQTQQMQAPAPSKLEVELPPAFEAVVLRCLALVPEQRFATAAELLQALDQALDALR